MSAPLADEPFATLAVEFPPEETARFDREFVASMPEWQAYIAKRRRAIFWNFLGGAILIPLGLVPLVAYVAEWTQSYQLVGVGLGISGVGAWSIQVGTVVRKQLRAYLAGTHARQTATPKAYTGGIWNYTFSQSGMRLVSTHYDYTLRWSLFTQVMELPSYVLVMDVGGQGCTIPRSAFASEAAATDFIARVRQILRERGAGVAERIRAYLATHDVACPTCKYALRGSPGEVCPECGLALTLAHIPAAADEPPKV